MDWCTYTVMNDQSSTQNANSSIYSKCELIIRVYGHHLTDITPSHCTIASESSHFTGQTCSMLLRSLLLKKGEWPWRKSSKGKDHNGLVWKAHELCLLNSAQSCTNYVDSAHLIFFTKDRIGAAIDYWFYPNVYTWLAMPHTGARLREPPSPLHALPLTAC